MAKILIVDDEKSIRRTLREILEFEKFEVDEAEDGMECVVKVKRNVYDVVLLDVKMPNMDGMETMDRIMEIKPELPVVMISGHGNIDTAVEAVKKGAFDFICKPPDLNRLLITLRNAMDRGELITETKALKRKVYRQKKLVQMIGSSPAMTQLRRTIDRVAGTEARVLIVGENGTGKELVARQIHLQSKRKDQPFVEVNCAAIPSELIESELFGHEKGAFTSAHKQRQGKFELQENKITRVGGEKSIPVDVRIIAATNKDIPALIRQGKFREDLYHRLAVIVIRVPSLRERLEDIPELVSFFNKIICEEYGIAERKFTRDAIEALKQHSWTGNIRELRNVVERLIILGGKTITKKDVVEYVYPLSVSRNTIETVA